jgi:hypothetical protein
MNNKAAHPIFVTKQNDDLFLAVSVDSPRFCVGATTPVEAHAKAQKALNYFLGVNERIAKPKEVLVISPVYEKRELRAA